MLNGDDTRFWVTVFLVSTFSQACVLDLLLLFLRGPDATMSAIIRDWFGQWPALPLIFAFGCGALTYHLAYK